MMDSKWIQMRRLPPLAVQCCHLAKTGELLLYHCKRITATQKIHCVPPKSNDHEITRDYIVHPSPVKMGLICIHLVQMEMVMHADMTHSSNRSTYRNVTASQ